MNLPDASSLPGSTGDPLSADLLVVGGGIAGMTAALEAAEAGKTVILVEREASLGGRVIAFNQYFPKLCPPTCGLEINQKRIKANPRITVFTLAEVEGVGGEAGNWSVQIKQKPRYVNMRCTACGECEPACPIEVDDPTNYGLSKRKAIHLPHLVAYPFRYVIDAEHASDPRMQACVEACPYDAIELDMQPSTVSASVTGIVWATGWRPYDATRLTNLAFGQTPNVITNVMMERLASMNGPTEGKIQRPSDQQEIKSIGFVQCAGSRDENHLPYCSAICCLASMKQATYVRSQYPDADVHLFYIDVRSPGRMEDFYEKVKADEKIHFHRGKVGKITEGSGGNVILHAENTVTGELTETEVELAVLATGMVPNTDIEPPPVDTPRDDYGFLAPNGSHGIIGAGTVTRPFDVASSVQDATGAALKALNAAGGR